jgi:hypothetical protein
MRTWFNDHDYTTFTIAYDLLGGWEFFIRRFDCDEDMVQV